MNFYRWFSLLQNQDTRSIAHLPPSNSRSCNILVSKCSVATHDTSALKIQRGFLIPFGKSETWLESKAATATEISSLTLYLISSQVLRKHLWESSLGSGTLASSTAGSSITTQVSDPLLMDTFHAVCYKAFWKMQLHIHFISNHPIYSRAALKRLWTLYKHKKDFPFTNYGPYCLKEEQKRTAADCCSTSFIENFLKSDIVAGVTKEEKKNHSNLTYPV